MKLLKLFYAVPNVVYEKTFSTSSLVLLVLPNVSLLGYMPQKFGAGRTAGLPCPNRTNITLR